MCRCVGWPDSSPPIHASDPCGFTTSPASEHHWLLCCCPVDATRMATGVRFSVTPLIHVWPQPAAEWPVTRAWLTTSLWLNERSDRASPTATAITASDGQNAHLRTLIMLPPPVGLSAGDKLAGWPSSRL